MNNKIPAYLTEKGNILRLIFLTALFALVFINIYTPFGSEKWYNIPKLYFFFYSSLVILTGVLVVVISRIIMYYVAQKKGLLYWQYFAWVAAEVLFMSLFYTLYTHALHRERDLLEIFRQSAINTTLVLLLPYSILWLYFSWRDKKSRLEQMVLGEQVHEENPPREMLSLLDEKGELRLLVSPDNLLYIEAADNYVSIKYLNKGKLASFMLRNTLKGLERNPSLLSGRVIRCHRSYMVNFNKVKVMRRTKEGVFLELDSDFTPDIPVSKTYALKVTALFSHFSL